jgi:short-subunit dehydrogenase
VSSSGTRGAHSRRGPLRRKGLEEGHARPQQELKDYQQRAERGERVHRRRILTVASLVAYPPGGPGMAAYYATKAFVLSLSRGLAAELSGSGVSVTALCPGPTHTAFESRSGASASLIYKRLSPDERGRCRGPAPAA